ncbi:MAG: UPF0182 family protein [Actinobacteria bacterium]|nr:UPF0182 family protein [Actinomycetota bacterium]
MSSFQFPVNPLKPKRPGPLALTIIALAILGAILVGMSGFYADLLWFRSVDFLSVWSTVLTTKITLFIFFGLITSLFITTNIYLAFKSRPIYVPVSIEADNLERYRGQLEPIRRWVLIAIAVGFFYFSGTSGMGLWESWLQFKNATTFGIKDSQFGLDISFFVFKLPFYQALIAWAISTLVLTIIAAAAVHYLYSGIRLQAAEDKTTVAARVQLSVLLGILVLIKAVAYWFDRYALELKEGKLITGLSYTDVNALLPAKSILAGISLICALLFFANIIRRSWVLPAAGVSLLVISSILIAGVYPAAIQQFQVKPSESSKEAPYIQRNIEATRAAYGLSDVKVQDYQATIATSAGQLKNDEATISNIRLLDPNVVPATFRQLQQIKPYYNFADSLDVDRYTIDGAKRDSVVAVRELNIAGNPARNWINDHLVYTHGFGFVSALGNTIDTDGKPTFSVGDIPPTTGLGKFEPRVYFGENVPDYSIIGGAKTSKPTELDYPDDKSANGQKNYTYTGKGGVPMGSIFTRLLFAIKYQEQRILLSNLINSDSKILFNRNPGERVAKVAPWLTLDGNIYPAVVDGRILWIVDGYTTSNGYPYSKKTNLADATTNSVTTSSTAVASLASKNVSYIRNSVKATVDAYDGTVKLYQWDTKDPVLATWSKSFPGTVTPKSAMSKSLLEHIRYPEDLFGVQRDVLSTYHVKTADAFYGGQDFWRVPTDPSSMGTNAGIQPPYYMTLKVPGQDKAAFSITSSFVPRGNRQNLTAFAVVNSDNGPDYGKISVLQLPRSTNISGPSQVASNFEAKPEVAQALSLLRQGGSDVVLANLLTLPVGGGLLYVQPVYVRATSNTSAYPLLQKVLVSFGDVIGFDDTLKGALDQVFGGNSGTVLNNTSQSTTGGTTSTTANSSLKSALASAKSALADSQAALKKGDFTAYGKAQDRLKAAIAAAIAAQK